MIYRIYKAPIYRVIIDGSAESDELSLDEEIKRLKSRVKPLSLEYRNIERAHEKKKNIENDLNELEIQEIGIEQELKEINDEIKKNEKLREWDATSADDSISDPLKTLLRKKYKNFFDQITYESLIKNDYNCKQAQIFFKTYSDYLAEDIYLARNFILNDDDSEIEEAKKTLKNLLKYYKNDFLDDDIDDKKFKLIIKTLNKKDFNKRVELFKESFHPDFTSVSSDIDQNSFKLIIKALDIYSDKYLTRKPNNLRATTELTKKEVLDGLQFLSEKLQNTFDDFQPTTNKNHIISNLLSKIENESKQTEIRQQIALNTQELVDSQTQIDLLRPIEEVKSELDQALGEYNDKKRLKAQENLFDDTTSNIVINSDKSLEQYLSHLKIPEDANAKQITFHKIKVDPSSSHDLRFGDAKIADFGYFDVNNSAKNQRVFYGNQDIIANDSIDEYRNQLAKKLALYVALKNKIKANTTQELPEINYATDTKITDIDKKICKLLIIAEDHLSPTDSSFKIDGDLLNLAKNYDSLNSQQLQNLNSMFFQKSSEDTWTDLEFKVSYGNLKLDLPRKTEHFFDDAKIMMQNEALKHNQDADFIKHSFIKGENEYLDNYRFYKTLDTESANQQKFRVKFSRDANSSNHAKVSVDIAGKFDISLDVVNICLDQHNDIYRQIILDKDDDGMPIIKSSSYVIKKNGIMHKIELDKKSYSIEEGKLTDLDKINIDKVVKREEISINLNGTKYVFRGKNGIQTTSNHASSITSPVPDKFAKFLENKSKNAKLNHQLNSKDNYGIFIKNSQTKQIIVATPKTMFKLSKRIDIQISEDHKIGVLKRDGNDFEIYAIKALNEDNYKLYFKKYDGNFEEYQNFKKTDQITLGKDNIQLNLKSISAKETPKTPSPSRFPTPKFPTSFGFGSGLQNEENFHFRVQSDQAIKFVTLTFKNDGSYSFAESQERAFVPNSKTSPTSSRASPSVSVGV